MTVQKNTATESQNQRIRLEVTTVGHLVPASCSSRTILEHIARDWVQIVLGYVQWGKLHNLSGNLFQCTVTHMVRFFLMFRGTFLWISFCPLFLVLLFSTSEKSLVYPVKTLLLDIDEVPSQSFLLEAEHTQLAQPFLVKELLQSQNHLFFPLLDFFQEVHVSCPEEPRIGNSTPGEGLSRGAGCDCWQCSSYCTPGYHWSSLCLICSELVSAQLVWGSFSCLPLLLVASLLLENWVWCAVFSYCLMILLVFSYFLMILHIISCGLINWLGFFFYYKTSSPSHE